MFRVFQLVPRLMLGTRDNRRHPEILPVPGQNGNDILNISHCIWFSLKKTKCPVDPIYLFADSLEFLHMRNEKKQSHVTYCSVIVYLAKP